MLNIKEEDVTIGFLLSYKYSVFVDSVGSFIYFCNASTPLNRGGLKMVCYQGTILRPHFAYIRVGLVNTTTSSCLTMQPFSNILRDRPPTNRFPTIWAYQCSTQQCEKLSNTRDVHALKCLVSLIRRSARAN